MVDIKSFKKACWEIRKKYNRSFLTKKQLLEAFKFCEQAEENKIKIDGLIKKIINL